MNDIKIFTDNIEDTALNQINALASHPAFQGCKIRIMPDVHAGTGCVIGFTADLGDKVIPNVVGVDIGCGMRVVSLGAIDIDYDKFDTIIKTYIPSGRNVYNNKMEWHDISESMLDGLFCFNKLKNKDWLIKSLGTLGSGNHFIEIDEDDIGNKYLVVHTGSRNLGKQVADIYQDMAIQNFNYEDEMRDCMSKCIQILKHSNQQAKISNALKLIKEYYNAKGLKIDKNLCYLDGYQRIWYLHDMQICQEFAKYNRRVICDIICKHMGWDMLDAPFFESVHNYIDDDNMIRKGAISANPNQRLIIPLNMRDGCIVGLGKGNPDWNYSAPHGAGRIMSRAEARNTLNMTEYMNSMKGIYTSSVCDSTIDEAPMAYKPSHEIINAIGDTVNITEIIKPVYNFKAKE